MHGKFLKLAASLAVTGFLVLQGCGGGGGSTGGASSSQAVTTQIVTGTAAYGAPLTNATITLIDANGTQKTAITGADGGYSLDVSGLTAPFLITATGQTGDEVRNYYALVTTAPAKGSSSTVNVTPLTTAIVALASSSGSNPAEFAVTGALSSLNTTKLAASEATVKKIISDVVTGLGLDASTFNPVSTAFVADLTSAGDKLLEAVKVSLGDSGVTLTNALAPIDSTANDASATSITLSDPTTSVSVLPKATVVMGSANAVLALLRTQLNACLALAPADRVSPYDSTGVTAPTALKGVCQAASMTAFDSTYLSGGKDLVGRWGPRLRDLPKGAKMGQAEIIASFARTDGGTNLSVRLPITAGSEGAFGYGESLRSDTTGQNFTLTGNQRKYDFGVNARIYKIVDLSTYERTGNGDDKGKNVGRLSRYEAALSFSFGIKTNSAANVYATRITGPGLPSAGLVMARSSVCGADTNLYVYSSDGTLPDATGKTAVFAATAASTNSWRMAVSPSGTEYKGTNLFKEVRGWARTSGPNIDATTGLANPTNYAETPVDLSTIPELPKYTFEVYSIGSNTPEIFTTTMTDKVLGEKTGANFAWASMTSDTLNYITNARADNPLAGALTEATFSWILPANAPLVTYVGMSGRGRDAGNVVSKFEAGSDVRPVGATSMKVGLANETDGLGNACTITTMPANSATDTSGNRIVQLTQNPGRIKMIMEYDHNGRAPQTAPTASSGIGFGVYNANAHPIQSGSVTLADGALGNFYLGTGSGFINAATVSNGIMSLDTTAAATDQSWYYMPQVWDSSSTYPKSLTLVARIAGNSKTGALLNERVMNFQTSWIVPGESAGYRANFQIVSNGAWAGLPSNAGLVKLDKVLTTSNVSLCTESAGCSVNSSMLDTSPYHIYQFVLTLNSASTGSFKVYVDGGSTPILNETVTAFTPSTVTDNRLRFDDSSSSAMTKSSMDWLVWTNGAYTPAELKGKLPSGLGDTTGY